MSRTFAIVVALATAACVRSTPPTASAADASRAHIELAELQQGRSLLVTKCGNCHRTPMPSEHAAADWPQKLDEMSSRANLDTAQRHLIEQYLVTMAR